MSSITIPSVAAMDTMFNNRMMAYAREFAGREALSGESSTEAPEEAHNRASKRKRDHDTSDDTEDTEVENEQETPEPYEQHLKIMLRINFCNNSIRSVQYSLKNQPAEQCAQARRTSSAPRPATPHPNIRRRNRPRGDQEGSNLTHPSLRSLRPRHTNTPATTTTSNASPCPPPTYIGTEKKERWDPVPLPSPLLPDDTEGPKAAWTRLFPHEEPFGEYGGKPAGWMQKMCWKEGQWKARGAEEPYVERFLGRKAGEMGMEEGCRRKRV